MDATLWQILRALYEAHAKIDGLIMENNALKDRITSLEIARAPDKEILGSKHRG